MLNPTGEVVPMIKKFFRRRGLQCAAEAVGGRPGAVDFAQNVRKTDGTGVRDRLSRRGSEVRHRTIEIGKAELCGIGTNGRIVRYVSAVAVGVGLTEIAIVGDRGIGPSVCRLP